MSQTPEVSEYNKPPEVSPQKSVQYLNVLDEETGPPERQAWGSKLEFILTCIGFAVGLGNVWRFPYLAYENGGGAFLLPYILMLFLIGFPMFFMEVSLGQFASLSPITIYNVSPAFKGVGIASVIVTAIITWYYNVIIAWILYYFFASMNSELPWASCGNWWNSGCCIDSNTNMSLLPKNQTFYTSSEEYYYNNVLQLPEDIGELGGLRWQLVLCLLLSWIIIFVVLLKGIESLGKVMYFVTLFPYVLLTIMLVRGATLPGSAEGIEYYITPEFSKLLEAKVWSDAATQIFYSLGISMGSLIAMASFNDFNNNILRDALIIPFVNCGTSIYAGFVIFSVLGYMANEKGVDISEVAAEGPGLIFVVYPEGLSTMPGAPVWATLFFFMMTTLGFSSQFSTAEGVIAAFCDEFPDTLRFGRRPMYLRLVLCVVFFLLALPMVCDGGYHLFTIINAYSGSYTLLIIAFFEIVVFQYVYGFDKFSEDYALMLGKKPSAYFFVQWKIIIPILISVVFIITCANYSTTEFNGEPFPAWLDAVGWVLVAIPLLVIFVVFLYTYCRDGGTQVLNDVTSPSSVWGPAQQRNRTGRYMVPTVEHVSCEDFTGRKMLATLSAAALVKDSQYESTKGNLQSPEAVYAQLVKKETASDSGKHSVSDVSSSSVEDTKVSTSNTPSPAYPPKTELSREYLDEDSQPKHHDASSVGGGSHLEVQVVAVDFHALSDESDKRSDCRDEQQGEMSGTEELINNTPEAANSQPEASEAEDYIKVTEL